MSDETSVTQADLQAWVDSLDERAQGMLRILVTQVRQQGRGDAMDEMLDAALAVQRSFKPKTPEATVATRLVGKVMRGRIAEKLGVSEPEGSA